MPEVYERRLQQAIWIFDLEDRYAREMLRRDRHPRPVEPIRFRLTGRMVNGVETPFPRALELVVVRTISGYHLWFGEVWLSPAEARLSNERDVPRRRVNLEDGIYVVRVESRVYQPVQRDDIPIPMPDPNALNSTAPFFFDLPPGHAYPFPTSYRMQAEDIPPGCVGATTPQPPGPTLLRGSLHAPDGQPMAGARIEVMAQGMTYSCTTDRSGQWVLVFDDSHPTGLVTVRVSFASGEVVSVPGVCVVRGREMSLPETALRGQVQGSGVGVRDAQVSISGQTQAVTTDDLGRWRFFFALNQLDTLVDVTATLPTGEATLTEQNMPVKARATNVVPTFRFAL